MTTDIRARVKTLQKDMAKDEREVLKAIDHIRSEWNTRKDKRNAELRALEDSLTNNQP